VAMGWEVVGSAAVVGDAWVAADADWVAWVATWVSVGAGGLGAGVEAVAAFVEVGWEAAAATDRAAGPGAVAGAAAVRDASPGMLGWGTHSA
jgi:hypothetical protein